jgi:hypothetical protein
VFQSYWALRQQAVPIGTIPQLDNTCSGILTSRLGRLAPQYRAAQLDIHPELLAMGGLLEQGHANKQRDKQRHYGYHPTEPPDSTPVVAWSVPPTDAAAVNAAAAAEEEQSVSSVGQLIAASHSALAWLQQHLQEFPLLQNNIGRRLSDAAGSTSSSSSSGGGGDDKVGSQAGT